MIREAAGRIGLTGGLAKIPIDRVWLATFVLLVSVIVFSPPQGWASLGFLLESWLLVAPFVVVSSLLSASVAASVGSRLAPRSSSSTRLPASGVERRAAASVRL